MLFAGSTMKVFVVDVEKDEVEPPFITRSSLSSTVAELKTSIAEAPQVSIKAEDMVILVEKHTNNYQPLDNDLATLQETGFLASDKVIFKFYLAYSWTPCIRPSQYWSNLRQLDNPRKISPFYKYDNIYISRKTCV